MAAYEWRINLPLLGVSVCFVSGGYIRILRHVGARTTIDYNDHVDAVFSDNGFSLWLIVDNQREDKIDLEYGVEYEYKTMPTFKEWLIAQKFEAPTFY